MRRRVTYRRNPARGGLFIARGRPGFILFFRGGATEVIAGLRKIWPPPASEPGLRTAPLKNKTGFLGACRPINRSPLRGLRRAVGHPFKVRLSPAAFPRTAQRGTERFQVLQSKETKSQNDYGKRIKIVLIF